MAGGRSCRNCFAVAEQETLLPSGDIEWTVAAANGHGFRDAACRTMAAVESHDRRGKPWLLWKAMTVGYKITSAHFRWPMIVNAGSTTLRTVFLVFPATPLAIHAETQAIAADPAGLPAVSILQMLLGLVVVIGILLLSAFLLRRLNLGRGYGGNGPLRVVGGVMLGARERIVLLEVGDTWVVVGLVPGQIRTLHTLPKAEQPTVSPQGDRQFSQWLRQITERRNER